VADGLKARESRRPRALGSSRLRTREIGTHISYVHRVTDIDTIYPYPRNIYPWIPYSIHIHTRGYENPPYLYPMGK
jgi:hypothetical protein